MYAKHIGIIDTIPAKNAITVVNDQDNVRLAATPPVFRLPPELLVRIFSFVAAADEPSSLRDRNAIPDDAHDEVAAFFRLRWINVTRVCVDWRRIALGSPTLWWNIDSRLGPRWMGEMLARSKDAAIDLDTRGVPIELGISHASSHLHHIRSLLTGSLAPNYTQHLSSPAPLLETFECHGGRAFQPTFSIPVTLFADSAPRLRRMIVNGGNSFPWSSTILTGLVHLELSLRNAEPPTADELGDVLRRMPTLERLSLRECLPAHFPSGKDDNVIALPHLTSLDFGGTVTACISTFHLLHIPASARLSMRCFSTDTSGDDYCRILPLLLEHMARADPNTPPLRRFILDIEMLEFFRFTAARSLPDVVEHDDFFFHEPPPTFRIEFHWPRGAQHIMSMLAMPSRIFDALPLSDMQIFTFLSSQRFWTSAFWLDVAHRFPRLRHVYGQARPLFRALFYPFETLEQLGETVGPDGELVEFGDEMLFPNLESLFMNHFTLRGLFNTGELTIEILMSLLQKRRMLGAPVQTLFVDSYEFSAADVAALSDVVSLRGHTVKGKQI